MPENQASVGATVEHMRGKAGLREALSMCQISLEEVGTEVQAQIAAFKEITGAIPTYLDGHQHVHVLPGIAAVVARIAAREGVRCVRIPDEQPIHFENHVDADRAAFFRTVVSQACDARTIMLDEGLVGADTFLGLGLMGADLTAQRLQHRLQALIRDAQLAASCAREHVASSGGGSEQLLAWGGNCFVGEYMCHAGKPSELGDDFSKSADRQAELEILSLAATRDWLACNKIELTSYEQLAAGLGLASRSAERAVVEAHHHEHKQAEHEAEAAAVLEAEGRPGLAAAACCLSGPDVAIGRTGAAAAAAPLGCRRPAPHLSSDAGAEEERSDEGRQGAEAGTRAEADTRWREGARGRGRLLILSSMTAATGNATTALRLAALARHHGWLVECTDVAALAAPGDLAALVERLTISAVLGVHAYRAGRLLLGCPPALPYAIVLGGTDVNVCSLRPVRTVCCS